MWCMLCCVWFGCVCVPCAGLFGWRNHRARRRAGTRTNTQRRHGRRWPVQFRISSSRSRRAVHEHEPRHKPAPTTKTEARRHTKMCVQSRKMLPPQSTTAASNDKDTTHTPLDTLMQFLLQNRTTTDDDLRRYTDATRAGTQQSHYTRAAAAAAAAVRANAIARLCGTTRISQSRNIALAHTCNAIRPAPKSIYHYTSSRLPCERCTATRRTWLHCAHTHSRIYWLDIWFGRL